MRHFDIKAAKNGITEIDIFGQIGDSFWEDGNTLESVKAEIGNIDNDIIINVASLGGLALEGLAIHDLIASHKHNVIVNIVGATASAGAIIAEAGDEINISENSLFLIHFSTGGVVGQAKDVLGVASDLEKLDNRMISILTKKTGKPESEIRALMEEDKFIDAEEAKEMGFVDNVIKPVKIAASINMNKVMTSNLSDEQKTKLESLNSNKMDLTAITSIFKEMKNSIISEIKALGEKKPADTETTTVEVKIMDNEEVQAKMDAFKAKLEGLNTTNESISTENTTLKGTETTLKEKITALELKESEQATEIERLKATQTETQNGTDLDPDEQKLEDEAILGNTIKAGMKNRFNL